MDETKQNRYFLKDSVRKVTDFSATDQNRGIAPPPVQKPFNENQKRIKLGEAERFPEIGRTTFFDAVARRKSRREFKKTALTMDELSFMLWATQGVRDASDKTRIFRNVPSAGNRHSFETYLAVFNVESLPQGIYRYLPLSNELLLEFEDDELKFKLARGVFGQRFAAKAAVTFIWTAIPYRTEWRYGAASHKVIALDAGHVCQNLYLACECIGAGTCAIAAYDQEEMDKLLHVDGEDEFTIYIAPVGKV